MMKFDAVERELTILAHQLGRVSKSVYALACELQRERQSDKGNRHESHAVVEVTKEKSPPAWPGASPF